jgi:hypothetical protein
MLVRLREANLVHGVCLEEVEVDLGNSTNTELEILQDGEI